MHVASKKQFPTPASLLREPLLMRHPASLCPAADHYWALIPTKWGVCGAVWKYHERVADFAEKPSNALLSQLLPPGLAAAELRKAVTTKYRLSNEVFGDGHGGFHPEVVPDWFNQLVRFMQSYYANSLHDLSEVRNVDHWGYWQARLDWSQVTPFCRKVLEATGRIPRGMVRTYGEIAKEIGNPKASRAVGAALGQNPWPVLVPCHRVVGCSGKLIGFSAPGGVKTKQRMLEMETPGLF